METISAKQSGKYVRRMRVRDYLRYTPHLLQSYSRRSLNVAVFHPCVVLRIALSSEFVRSGSLYFECQIYGSASPIPPFDDRFRMASFILGVFLSIFGARSLEDASLRLLVRCETPGVKAAADPLSLSPTR